MTTNVLTRWEEVRHELRGSKRHQQQVAAWLATRPAIVWYGDSWFSTPLYRNLARQSAEAIDGLRMIAGTPGAQAAKLFSASAAKNIADRLAGGPWDVVCLSAGGNDALSDRLEKVFAPWMKGNKAKITPEAAFQLLLDNQLFVRMRDRYFVMLDAVKRTVVKKRPHFRVVGHSYAPLRRIGQSGDLSVDNIGLLAILKDDVGPWLYGPMQKVLATKEEGRVFARLLLQQGFRDGVLEECRKKYDFFRYVDLDAEADLDDDTLWYDEIHPTEAGFARCVPAINAAIRAALPVAKQGAVSLSA